MVFCVFRSARRHARPPSCPHSHPMPWHSPPSWQSSVVSTPSIWYSAPVSGSFQARGRILRYGHCMTKGSLCPIHQLESFTPPRHTSMSIYTAAWFRVKLIFSFGRGGLLVPCAGIQPQCSISSTRCYPTPIQFW